jgi:hypothetical protein
MRPTRDAPPERPRRPWSRTDRPVPRLVVRPLQDFFRQEASAGLVLLGATIAALIWANVAGSAYEDVWTTQVTLTVGDWQLEETVRDLVNDGLMAIFFLVIGLEVKREARAQPPPGGGPVAHVVAPGHLRASASRSRYSSPTSPTQTPPIWTRPRSASSAPGGAVAGGACRGRPAESSWPEHAPALAECDA